MVEDHYRAEREFRNFRLMMLALPHGESGYTTLEIEDWLSEDYPHVIAHIDNEGSIHTSSPWCTHTNTHTITITIDSVRCKSKPELVTRNKILQI